MIQVILVFTVCCLCFIGGMFAGSWQTYRHMTGTVEERVVREMNYTLAEAGVRKYRFHTGDQGEIKLIIRK